MARFEKAQPIKKPFKAAFYGKQGSTKTGTMLLCLEGLAKRRGGRFAVVDCDPGSGTAPYLLDNPARTFHPKAFDFDVLRTRSLAETWEALESCPKEVVAIGVDPIGALWESCLEAWDAKNPNKRPSIADWGTIKKPYKKIIKWLMDSERDVILVGREKVVFGNDDDGKMQNLGVTMKGEGETAYEPDILLHFFLNGKPGSTTEQIPAFFGEKDRYSVFQGKTFFEPNWLTFDPVLKFLGTDRPPSEDSDERAMADGDMADDSVKTREKLEKSAGIMADIMAKASTVQTFEALGAIKGEANKLRRNLVQEHKDALHEVFESKGRELLNKQGGV
jgi:hypothetical protein